MADRLTIDGTLTVQTALIDWRDESATCAGVFRSKGTAALEVQYRVILDAAMLKTLAHAFTMAGVPLLRGPEIPATVEHVIPPTPTETMQDRIDKRSKAWRAAHPRPKHGNGKDHSAEQEAAA